MGDQKSSLEFSAQVSSKPINHACFMKNFNPSGFMNIQPTVGPTAEHHHIQSPNHDKLIKNFII
jgi:hypothetical protein